MSIRKRGKTWQIDYKDITGERVRKSGFKTKEEAKIALSQANVNNSKGISNIVDKECTINTACEYFLEKYAKIHCKQKTYDEYVRIIENEIIPFFNGVKIASLEKVNIESFLEYLRDEKELSNASINKYITLVGSILEKQIENGKLFQNVAKKVKKLKLQKTESRALTEEEIAKLLNTCKEVKPEFYPMLFTVLNTGLRRGEAIALMWENVDFEKNEITVKYSEYKGKLCSPKSDSSVRKVKITNTLKKVLIEQKLKSNGSKFVFPNSNGELYMGNNITRRFFTPVMKATNIGQFRFHDLRHTYGSQLIAKGADYKYVQEQMGHSSANITLNVYAHVLPESTEKAITILDEMYKVI